MNISPSRSTTVSLLKTHASNEGGCPHGAPRGACPACNGGGGGGGSAGKKAGLMTWNEAYGLWNALRVARIRNEDYLKGANLNQFRQNQEATALQRGLVFSVLVRLQPALATFLQSPTLLLTTLARGFGQTMTGFRNALSGFREAIVQPFLAVAGIADKLATILGDARKLLDDLLHHNLENLKALIRNSRFVLLMQQVEGLLKQVLQTFSPRRAFKTVGRRLSSVLGKIFGKNSEDLDEENEENRLPAVNAR
jgi:hypothetical protein